MKVFASLNKFRMSPRKVRLVVDLARGMSVEQAKVQLKFLNKKAAKSILNLLDSAIANAKNNFKLDEKNLYISEIFVNEGPTLKRWRARAMGRSAPIKKRTSNIRIGLEERVVGEKVGKDIGVKVNEKIK
jgi:large subunit ribosomal protein L22